MSRALRIIARVEKLRLGWALFESNQNTLDYKRCFNPAESAYASLLRLVQGKGSAMPNISRKALILSAITTLLALPMPTAAQGPVAAVRGPSFSYIGCAYYEHANFAGAARSIGNGINLPFVGEPWNDKISSLACHTRCSVTIYEHANYAGARMRLVGAIGYVGDGWNDKISGLAVRCN